MHPTLFHIPQQIGPVPVLGFGVVLGIWAILSLAMLVWLVRKYGLGSEALSNVPLLLLIGAIIWWVLPRIGDEHGLPVRSYGLMLLVAVVAAAGLIAWRLHRFRLNPELALSVALWAVLPGVVGARVFFVIEYWNELFWPVFVSEQGGFWAGLGALVNLARGGLVIYGGVLGGALGLWAFARQNRLPTWAVGDLVAPALLLGMALGRVGCFLNGCCFGGVCEHTWAIRLPPESPAYQVQAARGQFYGFRLGNSAEAKPMILAVQPDSPAAQAGLQSGDLIERINGLAVQSLDAAEQLLAEAIAQGSRLELKPAGREPLALPAAAPPARSLPVHPTQLYSAINALLLCLVLLAYEPFARRDGELFALLLTIYPITRFLIEIVRDDEPAIWITGLTISQNISLLALCGAAGLWWYLRRRPAQKTWG